MNAVVHEVEQAVGTRAFDAAVGDAEIEQRDRAICKPAMLHLDRAKLGQPAVPCLRPCDRAVRHLRGVEDAFATTVRSGGRRVDGRDRLAAVDVAHELGLHEDHVVVFMGDEHEHVGVNERRAHRLDEVIAANPKQVKQYRAGKKTVAAFFVGQVMKLSKGQANPQLVNELVSKKLG